MPYNFPIDTLNMAVLSPQAESHPPSVAFLLSNKCTTTAGRYWNDSWSPPSPTYTVNCLYMKPQLSKAVHFRYLLLVAGTVWPLWVGTPVSLVLVFSKAGPAMSGQKSLKYRILFLSKFVCSFLELLFLFCLLVCFVLSFLMAYFCIFDLLWKGLKNHNICFSSLGLFRHDDPTQHLGSDFSFRALYKH